MSEREDDGTEEGQPAEPENVALDRADEVMQVQDQASLDSAGIVPAVTEVTAERQPTWASARLARLLFAVAAAGLVLIVVAFFWPAFEGAVEKGSMAIRSGLLLKPVELLVDSDPPGARVIVNGNERGRTAALLTVECESGGEMAIDVLLEGYAPSRQKVPCNDRPLKLKVKLEKQKP